MGNPPFEDVSPIEKMVVFHCYVSLPEGISFFCFHQLKVDQRWKSSKPYHFACFFVVQAQLEETKTGP